MRPAGCEALCRPLWSAGGRVERASWALSSGCKIAKTLETAIKRRAGTISVLTGLELFMLSRYNRYDRQLRLLGIENQNKLKRAKVLVVGLGGLGSTVSLFLAAAGVGRLVLLDRDRVEMSNLNRQILYTPADIGAFKASVAEKRVREFNPEVDVVGSILNVQSDEVENIVKDVDVIVDCLDNWEDRFRVNELAVKHSKPLVHAAVEGWWGHLTTILPTEGPCLNCIFPQSLTTRRVRVSILGAVAGALGCMEALEAIKVILDSQDTLVGVLLYFDFKSHDHIKIRVKKSVKCPVCKPDSASR
uniref:HesA/MoeB/ThiF family protein n=1 Tax=Fervidicoccus fontis TaxID=683846 RepID=A0A7J3ZL93_9CREN